MSIVSHAQNFEDVLLWRAFRDVELGRYLDIGAQDPVRDSISLAFYQNGWRGMHVEPTPAYASLLREARPDETVIQAAVSNATGLISFHEFPKTGLSTGKPKIARQHRRNGFEHHRVVVPSIRLDQVLEMAKSDFHWMKIDTEGMELEVLRSWGESVRRPWVLLIESVHPGSKAPSHLGWYREVVARGYTEVYFDGLNRFFVHDAHRALAQHFATPPNVFDGFAISAAHFSVKAVERDFREELEAKNNEVVEREAELSHLRQCLVEYSTRESGLRCEISDTRVQISRLQRELSDASAQVLEEVREQRTYAQHLQHSLDKARVKESTALAQIIAGQSEFVRILESERVINDANIRAAERSAAIALQRFYERTEELERRLSKFQEDTALAVERAAVEREEALRERVRMQADAERAEVESDRKVAVYRSAAEQVDALIQKFAGERTKRWQKIGEACGLLPVGRAERDLLEWIMPSAASSSTSSTAQMSDQDCDPPMYDTRAVEERNPYLRAGSLAELLTWNDADFVRCAYVTVLGRQPDLDGEAHYTHLLRHGRSKMEVLWQLRKSPEGHRHDPGIKGFDRALRKSKWARSPIAGWFMRFANEDENVDDIQTRRHRQSINEINRLFSELKSNEISRIFLKLHSINDQIGNLQSECSVDLMMNGALRSTKDSDHEDTMKHINSSEYRLASANTQRIFRKLLER